MTIKAIVSTAHAGEPQCWRVAFAVDAATKKNDPGQARNRRTIYYRQSDPGYYAQPELAPGPASARAAALVSFSRYGDQAARRTLRRTMRFRRSQSFDYQNRNSFQGSFTRMPLADPWDIPGWPKY